MCRRRPAGAPEFERSKQAIAIINGTNSADSLYGSAGADEISGGGDDTLKGFGGADRFDGGAGIDTVFYGDSTVGVDILQASGFSGTSTLDGGSGDDTFKGIGAADTMYGGPGNDHYYVDNVGDIGREYAGEGTSDVV